MIPLRLLGLLSALLAAGVSRAPAQAYAFSTLAGKPPTGSADGPGAAAQFDQPSGLAMDASGNLYVADASNCTIRRITPAGVVSTLAGVTGQRGARDGPAASALFHFPAGIAVDSLGNVFVADTGNSTVRQISPDGTVSTIAGAADGAGGEEGPAFATGLGFLTGLADDRTGGVLIAAGDSIRRLKGGVVTKVAGHAGIPGSVNQPGELARFDQPRAVATDRLGNIYVADTGNHTVRKITAAGVVSTLAGQPGFSGEIDGTGSAARFHAPRGIAIDSTGTVFVADGNASVRKISPTGGVTTLAKMRLDANVIPVGIVVDDRGIVFVADVGNHAIWRITAAGVATVLAGGTGSVGSADGPGNVARFYQPQGVSAGPDGSVYVADTTNNVIRRISPEGVVSTFAGIASTAIDYVDGPVATARFGVPKNVALDRDGNVFVTDFNYGLIRRISGGVVTTFAGSIASRGSTDGVGENARFIQPWGLTIDGNGNLFVAEVGSGTVRKITPNRVVTTLAGSAGNLGTADGAGSSARFGGLLNLAADQHGIIFVADASNGSIRKIAPDGTVTTLVGVVWGLPTDDGPISRVGLALPGGIAVDREGNVFVGENGTHLIRRISTAGIVSTIGGAWPGSADGTGSAARFDIPLSLAVDNRGTLFVADFRNNTIRRGVRAPSRITNLSVRSPTAPAAETMVVGFNILGGNPKSVLVRGVGPALQQFGVTGALPNPILSLQSQDGVFSRQNDGWSAADATAIALTATRLGAFPLAPASRDAALLESLRPGSYTAAIGGGTGLALLELYDADGANDTRLANVSARAPSGFGADVLIAGFVVAGEGTTTVVIRGIGPTLGNFGIGAALADPRLSVLAGTQVIASNDNWEVALAPVFAGVGAFPLSVGSRDAALIVTLGAGNYTVQLSGASSARGIALIELYEAP